MKNKFIIIFFLFNSLFIKAQTSGNQVLNRNQYKNQIVNNTNKIIDTNKLYLSDTSFLIESNVVINVIADSYIAVFGVSQEANSLKSANEKINERIQTFINSLQTNGFDTKDIFVDITTQTQISDYRILGNYAEQYIDGFELKKNVIIKFNNIKDLDKIIMLASENQIYDLAKVDYVVLDVNAIYNQLFKTAVDVINNKKQLYTSITNMKISTNSEIYDEEFYCLNPQELYQQYKQNISTKYYNNNYRERTKNLRDNNTYYYERINYTGYDKIINPIVIEPVVSYVLKIKIKYNIQTNKK